MCHSSLSRAALSRIALLTLLSLMPHTAFSQPARTARTAWTTSRISGSPDPAPPLQTVQKFSALKFDRPLLIRTGVTGDACCQQVKMVG